MGLLQPVRHPFFLLPATPHLTRFCSKYSIYKAGVDDWSAILKLSHEWRFGEVKSLACRELERFEIEPVQKIDLYQRYEIDRKLLIPSYSKLTFRLEPLSLKEGRKLGL